MVSFGLIPYSQIFMTQPQHPPLPVLRFSLKPGDALQIGQKTQQLMAIALGMKPSWAVGT